MTIFLTGSAGYLGSAVMNNLSDCDDNIIALRRPHNYSKNFAPADQQLPNNTVIAECDLGDCPTLSKLFDKYRPSSIIHCAAMVGAGSDENFSLKAIQDNILATANLGYQSAKSGVGTFINASTTSLYGPRNFDSPLADEDQTPKPQDPYSLSKFLAEQTLELASVGKMRSLSVRFVGIHGAPRQSGALASMITKARQGETINLSNGQNICQFISVADAANLLIKCLALPLGEGHTICNAGGIETYSLLNWVDLVGQIANTKPIFLDHSQGIGNSNAVCIERARSILGFEPTPATHWVAELSDWLDQNQSKH